MKLFYLNGLMMQGPGFRLRPEKTGHTIARAGLDTQQPHSRRIRHPQAATDKRDLLSPNPYSLMRLFQCVVQCSGAWVGSQRKSPRCAFFCRRSFAATRSALSLQTKGQPS